MIGLIASTEQGAEILSDYGWLAATTALGEPTGMCVPENISKFMTVSFSRLRRENSDLVSVDPMDYAEPLGQRSQASSSQITT